MNDRLVVKVPWHLAREIYAILGGLDCETECASYLTCQRRETDPNANYATFCAEFQGCIDKAEEE
ncbi:MAG: hypothetical protein J6R18_05745 [Kiritimatiellae bacterium]|nr:hypothetical protein [Kiritimatiellia bacterium]